LLSVEDIVLLDLDPGKGPPLGAELIARLGEGLLVCEMRLPRRDPFAAGYEFVLHDHTPWGGARRARLSAPCKPVAQVVAGVIQPTTAPPGSRRMAMRPTPGISNSGRISEAPAAVAFFARWSTSSTAR